MLRLREERIKRGWSILELSFQARIHPATIGKLESGRLKPYAPHRRKLEAVFQIPADKLFQEVSDNATGTGNPARTDRD